MRVERLEATEKCGNSRCYSHCSLETPFANILLDAANILRDLARQHILPDRTPGTSGTDLRVCCWRKVVLSAQKRRNQAEETARGEKQWREKRWSHHDIEYRNAPAAWL